jgi:hypothetical protein
MLQAPPIVNYGLLEDLLDEVSHDREAGKTIQSIRATTNYRTRSGGGIMGEETTVSLVVSSLTSEVLDQVIHMQYGLWVWRVAHYAELHGHPASPWTREEADALAELVLEHIKRVIETRTGIPPQKGMYCLSQEWLEIKGGTGLVDLKALREEVKPSQEAQDLL